MSRRSPKRLWRAVLVVASVFVILFVAARLLIPAEKVRGLVVQRITAATGADVSFGDARIQLLPRLSVAVADGRIAGTGEALRAATGTENPLASYAATIDKLEVSLAIGPLFRKRVEIGKVRLVKPRLEVTTVAPPAADVGATPGEAKADGLAGERPERGTGGGGGATMALAVAGVEVRDGELRWTQDGTGRAVRVTGWQQDIKGGDLTALVARLPALLGSPGGAGGEAVASRPPAAAGPASLAIDTRIGSLVLSGFGKVSPLELADVRLVASVEAPSTGDALTIHVTQASWGPLDLGADLLVEVATSGGRRLRGTWRLADCELRTLHAAAAGFLPPAPANLAEWLGSQPIVQGRLTLSGAIDLPWPLPQPPDPAMLLAGISAEGALQGVRLTLPEQQGTAGIDAGLALADGMFIVQRLRVGDAAETLRLEGALSSPLPKLPGRLQADLSGGFDLSALSAWQKLLPPPQPKQGEVPRPAAGEMRLAGRLAFTAKVDIAEPPLGEKPDVWSARLQGGTLGEIRLSGSVEGLTVENERLRPPLAVPSVTWQSDLRTATVKLEHVDHPALRGGGTVQLTKILPAPHAEVDVTLSLLDADYLTQMLTAPTGATGAAPGATAAAGRGAAPRPWELVHAGVSWLAGAAGAAASVAAAPAPGELLPLNLTAAYRARAETLVLQKVRYSDVTLSGTLAQRVFDIPQAAGRLDGGTITGRGKLDYAADPFGLLTFTAKVEEIPASSLIAPYAKAVASLWEGKIGGDVAGSCRLKDQQAALQSLSLAGLALSNNGVIHGASMLEGVSRLLGQRQDLKEIRFKDFMHHFTVEDGRYVISDLQLHGWDTDWWGEGWLSFDGGIDMRLTVKLPADFKPELGDLGFLAEGMRGADGRIAVAMDLKGRAANPEVSLDLTGAKAKTQEKVQEEVKKGLGGLLDKLKRK